MSSSKIQGCPPFMVPLLIHMLLGHDERGVYADKLLFINIQNSFIVLSW